MRPFPRGTTLLITLLVIYALCHLGRLAFREEGPPAFFMVESLGVTISLGNGFPAPGIRQIVGEATPLSVIKLAIGEEVPINTKIPGMLTPLRSGERLALKLEDGNITGLERSWLPAAQRMALSIPLHPDSMSQRDWECLPGIGSGLASRIEVDRQKNGDFYTLEALVRVPGIGEQKIKAWKKFFQ